MSNKTINHFIPWFHIKKWKEIGSQVYSKSSEKITKIRPRDKRFAKKGFYSKDGTNELETRIAKFENYIAPIIKRIDEANDNVSLSGKELYLLKLYCFLCACRQDNTTEVIIDDESAYYQSNQYRIGIPLIHGKEDILIYTEDIVHEFETIVNDKSFSHLESSISSKVSIKEMNKIEENLYHMHLSIFRNEEKNVAFSDVFAIIENTMDGNHLYTYIPISPQTVLCLVNTEYYLNKSRCALYRKILPIMHGGYGEDFALSMIFYEYENDLCCSYSGDSNSEFNIALKPILNCVIDNFNAIMYQDCKYFIFKDDVQLNKAKVRLAIRYVTCG